MAEHVTAAPPPAVEDAAVLAALRRGDEAAFVALVQRHQAGMLRVAQSYVGSRALAEEVVQDTWLAVVRGLDAFQGRSSLRTWIYSILVNRARSRAVREPRTEPLPADSGGWESVPASRFQPAGAPWPGGWAVPPRPWELPDDALAAKETRAAVDRAIATLPPAQQQVIVLRDVEGWPAAEVCDMLGLTAGHQRVLLHRARAKVRAALEDHLETGRRRAS